MNSQQSISAAFGQVLISLNNQRDVALVPCSKTKRLGRHTAGNLYSSWRFEVEKEICTLLGLNYFIVSAKHGCLHPSEPIETYDVAMKQLDPSALVVWKKRFKEQFCSKVGHDPNIKLLSFLSASYQARVQESVDHKLEFISPLQGMSLGKGGKLLKTLKRSVQRKIILQEMYSILAVRRSAIYQFKDFDKLFTTPPRGLYIFFDGDEYSSLSEHVPRIVRIGTHGVSMGSKSTLRQRLRAHFGTQKGLGNHRSSVFRLHVGQSIIARDRLNAKFPNWGKGQSASSEIRKSEDELEIKVSSYIRHLHFCCIPIADDSGPTSQRATIEKNLIGLLTEDRVLFDKPHHGWLGSYSTRSEISSSGLWNVNHTFKKMQDDFLQRPESLLNYIRNVQELN